MAGLETMAPGANLVCGVDYLRFVLASRFLERSQDDRDGLGGGCRGGIDDQVGAAPRFVVPGLHLVPCGEDEVGNIGGSGFDAASVFGLVGTDGFDFNDPRVGFGGNGAPGISGDRQRIDGIGDDGAAEAEVVGGEAVGDGVAFGRGGGALVAQRLLDGVDADVGGAEIGGETAGDGGFAGAGEAGEGDEQWAGPNLTSQRHEAGGGGLGGGARGGLIDLAGEDHGADFSPQKIGELRVGAQVGGGGLVDGGCGGAEVRGTCGAGGGVGEGRGRGEGEQGKGGCEAGHGAVLQAVAC